MKLDVSMPDDDVEFLDTYARTHDLVSRSAVVRQAVGMLRSSALAADYEAAWQEWDESGDAAVWDKT